MENTNIKSLRKKIGLTQSELGENLGVSTRTIASWEAGSKIPKSKTILLNCFFTNNLEDKIIENEVDHFEELLALMHIYNLLSKGGSDNFNKALIKLKNTIDSLTNKLPKHEGDIFTQKK